MLGAQAVQMGTCFVATTECQVHQNYKDMILKAKDIDTRVTGRTTGHPVRALRNQMTREYLKKEAEGAPFEGTGAAYTGRLTKSSNRGRCEKRKRYVRTDRRTYKRRNELQGSDPKADEGDGNSFERNCSL